MSQGGMRMHRDNDSDLSDHADIKANFSDDEADKDEAYDPLKVITYPSKKIRIREDNYDSSSTQKSLPSLPVLYDPLKL
jgi:hypothetical protein